MGTTMSEAYRNRLMRPFIVRHYLPIWAVMRGCASKKTKANTQQGADGHIVQQENEWQHGRP